MRRTIGLRTLAVTLTAMCLLFVGSTSAQAPGDGGKQMKAKPTDSGSLDHRLASYEKLAAIFEAVDPTPVKGKRWVSVESGPVGWNDRVEGWLLDDKQDALELLDANGYAQSLRKPRSGKQQPKIKAGESIPMKDWESGKYTAAWRVQPGEYRAFCERLLKQSIADQIKERSPTIDDHEDAYSFANRRAASAEIVIHAARLAHWAAEVGDKPLALDLYSLADRGHAEFQQHGWWGGNPELHLFVANEIASGYCTGAICSGHRGTRRSQLLKSWEFIAKIPFHNRLDEAKQMVADYGALLAEDKTWKEPDAATLAKLTPQQKVAYWMYRLRDADAEQWSDPGYCSVFGDMLSPDRDPKVPNPAVELEKLGYDAIPELIAHLDDTRPTRCQADGRRFAPESYYLLRYGDCCQQIFESITGHTIYTSEDGSLYPIRDGKGKACEALAAAWWQEFQRKGERRMLIEGTQTGDRDSPRQAERLVAKYRADAFEPIVTGIRNSKLPEVRRELLSEAEKLPAEKLLPLFRDEAHGPHRASRVEAYWFLIQHGDEAGLRLAVDEFVHLAWDDADNSDERFPIENLISCLAHSGDSAAIQTLAADFNAKPLNVRKQIVESLADAKKDLRGQPLTPAVQKAIDSLLVAALDDAEEVSMLGGRSGGRELRDPAIGDLAAEALTARWGKPELFDICGHLGERERERLAVKKVWLETSHGKQLSLSPPRKVEPAADSVVQPLLDAIQLAVGAEAKRAAVERLEKLGASAVPAIQRSLKTAKWDDAAKHELGDEAQQLALTIEEVRFAAGSVEPNEELRRAIQAVRGKPITVNRYMDILRYILREQPHGSRGVMLRVERPGDGSGAVLIVGLVPDKPPRKGLSPQLQINERILLDERALMDNFQGMAGINRSVDFSELDWGDLTRQLQTALRAKPEQYLLIRVECQEAR